MRFPYNGKYALTQGFGNDLVINGVHIYKEYNLNGHNGLDFGLPSGTEVVAPHGGVVKEVADEGKKGYGKYIKIENEKEGSVLAHLKDQLVKVGDTVSEGQLIGHSGNTGNSTAAHLHWGYYKIPRNRNNGYNGFIDQLPIVDQATASVPQPSYTVYPHTRNVKIQTASGKGVNVRTTPNTKDKNVKSSLVNGSDVQVEGFVEGEAVDNGSNNLWWKLNGVNLFIWTGLTNFVPSIKSEPKAAATETITVPQPLGLKTREELEEEIQELKDDLKRVVLNAQDIENQNATLQEELKAADEKIIAQEQTINGLNDLRNVNTRLSEENATLQRAVQGNSVAKELAFVEAFQGWELISFPKGAKSPLKLIPVALKVVSLMKDMFNHDYVLGWKKDAKMYKVGEAGNSADGTQPVK